MLHFTTFSVNYIIPSNYQTITKQITKHKFRYAELSLEPYSFSVSKELPAFYGRQNFITTFTWARKLSPICVRSFSSMKIHCNIMASYVVPLAHLPITTLWRLSFPPYLLHVRPFEPSWLYHPNNIWWGRIAKLLVMQSLPVRWNLVPVKPKYLPQHPILKTPSLYSSLDVRDQVPYPYKTTNKIKVLDILIIRRR